ncbi:MAG TPA: DUF4396 domain-containing protein [Candidatus Saccharimonadales bacterium]|nr:DUF4396 domain-containing protein [Candidatus Saccharimonadales bacterium]
MQPSLTKTAASATLHCLTGCAIGEVVGMVVTTAFSVAAAPSVAVSIILAFAFGYTLSMLPLRKAGLSWRRAFGLALAADTASIAAMELTDNAFVLAVPGAIHAGLSTFLFWWSLLISLAVAFAVAFPLNRWLISRGKGHAVVHEFHNGHH